MTRSSGSAHSGCEKKQGRYPAVNLGEESNLRRWAVSSKGSMRAIHRTFRFPVSYGGYFTCLAFCSDCGNQTIIESFPHPGWNDAYMQPRLSVKFTQTSVAVAELLTVDSSAGHFFLAPPVWGFSWA